MHKRMTISIDETVGDGLVRIIGRRKISQFLENLARPYVVNLYGFDSPPLAAQSRLQICGLSICC